MSAVTVGSDGPRPGGTGRLSEHTVSRIGYGASQLHRLRGHRAAALALVCHAVERGVDHFDTAQFYGNGFVNEILGEALQGHDDAIIVSKIGADPDPAGPFPMRVAQRPEELRASIEANLRSLGLEQLPVVNLRRMDGRHRIPARPEQDVDLDDQLAVMTALRDEGLIGSFGLSSLTLDTLRQAIPAGPACVQNHYNLLARDDEELLALCEIEGIAWVPFFPLGSAVPGMSKVTDEPAVIAVAAELGVTPSQVGLAWLLHLAPNVLLIPGTANLQHMEQNLNAGSITLDDAAMNRLDIKAAHQSGHID